MKSEGEVRLTIGDSGYTPPFVTAERVAGYLQNIHLADEINNFAIQIFPGAPEIWVEDGNEDRDIDLTEWMRETAKRVKLYPAMQIALRETLGYGCSVKSPGYARINGKFDMTELRNLPAETFAVYPGHGTTTNSLMPGIVVNGDDTEVWQTEGLDFVKSTQIRNFTLITEPTAPKPAGRAYCLPCYAVLGAINHANKAADQQVARVGAPLIFPQVSGAITPDLKAWGDAFLKKWGKNTGFVIPPGITFPDVKLKESDSAEKRLSMLIEWIKSYFNPTTVMKQAGTTIGGTDSGAAEIWANFIAGTQAWLESAFEELFKPLLAANGYEDRYVRIRFKRPSAKRMEEVREQLKIGIAAGKLTTLEIRRNLTELDLDDTTPELIAELDAMPAAPGFAQATIGQGTPNEDLLAAENVQEETGAEEKAARELERKLKMIDDRASAALKKIIGASK